VDRAERLRQRRDILEAKADGLLASGEQAEAQATLAEIRELDAAILEAEGQSLTGDGLERP
jgi:hypothetical protein